MALIDPALDVLACSKHVSALRTLASAYPHLSAAERVVAKFILEQPHRLGDLSAAGLAQAAGASEATVYRLCRTLGFSGYTELRAQIGEAVARYAPSFIAPVVIEPDAVARSSMALARYAQAEGGAQPPQGMGRMEAAVYSGVRVLLDAVDIPDADLDKLADAILACRRVIFAGVGGYTGRIAEMAAFGLQRIGVTSMPWVDGQLHDVTQEMFTPEDVVVGISYSGNNKAVVRALQLANKASAFTVGLTNYRLSPVAKHSRLALVTSFRESHIQNFDLVPRLAQLLVIDALQRAVAERIRARVGKGAAPSRR